jgi:hypothetical protein
MLGPKHGNHGGYMISLDRPMIAGGYVDRAFVWKGCARSVKMAYVFNFLRVCLLVVLPEMVRVVSCMN